MQPTIENVVAIPAPGVPGTAFHGQADLVFENVSTGNARFALLGGAVFEPMAGDAQAHISHQNPVVPPELPETGGSWGTQGLAMVLMVAAGLVLLLAGTVLRHPERV